METKVDAVLESIRKIRNNKGFSQEYMASKLGMKQVGYGLIENGARGLQFEMLSQIAVVFGMSVIDLIAYPDVYVKKTDENAPSEPIEAILHQGQTLMYLRSSE